MSIIGISGLAGAGKDTVASILCSRANHVSIALADPLKRICKETFGFSEEQLWGPSAKRNEPDPRYPREHGHASFAANGKEHCACCGRAVEDYDVQCFLTPRYALQTLGTEFGRACYPNIWVEIAMRTAKILFGPIPFTYSRSGGLYSLLGTLEIVPFYGGVSIPDVRFQNEMDAIRAGGGKVIRIVRPGAGLVGATGKHASETEQTTIPDEAFDWVIVNDGTLDDLHEKVTTMMAKLG